MGRYLDPGNDAFKRIISGEFVDKTGRIEVVNRRIGTTESLMCVSRPRRFGKSFAAQILCAYYDRSCDSRELFDRYEIAGSDDYLTHLNQYHVIYLDIAGFLSDLAREHAPVSQLTMKIMSEVRSDLVASCPELAGLQDVSECLLEFVKEKGRKIVFILDEWDAVIREAKYDDITQRSYLNLLRAWFKNGNFTPFVVAAAYMTGILPIKKDGSQSAISDFVEYPILYPDGFAEYSGFTEKEVRALCLKYNMDFEEMKSWYDGYVFSECGDIYNPYSVMSALRAGKCRSFWQKTTAAESLMTYVNMDFDGLQETIARLISGESIEVNVDSFENDFESFRCRDDVLTLLIHLGYLTFDENENTVRIPNEEVRIEFRRIASGANAAPKWAELLKSSRQLLEDTLAGNEEAVANAIDKVRTTEYAPAFYNNEQALRYVVKFAYLSAVDQYVKIEELPSGHGLADVVYLPKKRSPLPALLIELKWNKSAEGAISQIKAKKYPAVLEDFGGEILLIGISYDEQNKRHSCVIERV